MRVYDDRTQMDKVLRELENLNKYSLQIGIFGEDDSFMQMIAGVHEFGLNIRAKHGKYLTIPTKAAGTRKAREIPGLFKPKGKNILAVADGKGGLTIMFYLKESVKIPERSFIRSTFDEQNDKWVDFFERLLDQVVNGSLTAEEIYNQLGAKMASDVQKKIKDIKHPTKAPATLARNPGMDSPLIVTGRLRQSVTWKVVRA